MKIHGVRRRRSIRFVGALAALATIGSLFVAPVGSSAAISDQLSAVATSDRPSAPANAGRSRDIETGGPSVSRRTAVPGLTAANAAPRLVATAPGLAAGAAAAPADRFVPVSSTRIVDTAIKFGLLKPLAPRTTVTVIATGVAGVPASGVSAVLANVTAKSTVDSTLTVWAKGTPRPTTVAMAVDMANTDSTLVLLPVGTTGATSLYNELGTTDVRIDVLGWFPIGGDLRTVTPMRLIDTAKKIGRTTKLPSNTPIDVQVTGKAGIPATGVGAVVVDLTAGKTAKALGLTAWTSGSPRPPVTSVDTRVNAISTGLAIVPVSAAGKISLFSTQTTDLAVDVLGWLPTDSSFRFPPVTAALDTIARIGATGPLKANTVTTVTIAGRSGVPADAVAVLLNVAVSKPTATTSVTVWPSGTTRPTSALMKVNASGAARNATLVPLGTDGAVSIHNATGSTDLRAHIIGWVAPAVRPAYWKFDQASLLLNKGQSLVVTLIPTNADGTVMTDAPQASGVELTSSDPSVTARSLGANRVQITAGQTITSATIIATPAAAVSPATMNASVVVMAAGAEQIPDNRVIAPVPYASGAATLPVGADGLVAGFTLAELKARTFAPANPNGAATLVDPDSWFPLVLSGAPPAVGSIVITAGGSGVSGTVIEPPDAPTLQRAGKSLVTVKSMPLADLYPELVYNYSYTPPAPAAAPFARQANLMSPAARTMAIAAAPVTGTTTCTGELTGAQIIPTLTYNPPTPVFDVDIDTVAKHYKIVVGATPSVKIGLAITAQASLKVSCDVQLPKIGTVDIPAPAGPASGLASSYLAVDFVGTLELKLKLGARTTAGYECTIGALIQVGFEVTNGVPTNLSKGEMLGDPGKRCVATKPALSDLGTSLRAEQFEVTAGVYLRMAAGTRVGGLIAREFGEALGYPELGQLQMFEAKIGPALTIVQENEANVLSVKASTSKLEFGLKAEVGVKNESLEALLKRLKIPVPLDSIKVEIPIPPFLSLAVPTSESVSYIRNNEAPVTPGLHDVINVEPDDDLDITPKLTSEVGTPKMTKMMIETPAGFIRSPAFTVAAGVDFKLHVTQEFCDATMVNGAYQEQVFRMLGESSGLLFDTPVTFPVYGGTFKLKCTQGKIRFETESLDITDGPKVDWLLSSGTKRDVWTVRTGTAEDTWTTWLEVTPRTGNLSPAETDERVMLMTFSHKGVKKCNDPHSGVVAIVSRTRGTIKLPVKEDSLCSIKFNAARLRGNGGTQVTSLSTRGILADTYRVVAAPSWLTIVPRTGQLAANQEETSFNMGFTFDRRQPTCEVQTAVIDNVIVRTETRGDTSIQVIWDKVDIDPNCPSDKDSTSWGDPHLTTFDNSYYDAQVVGEYVYARTRAGAAVPFEVRARQELTTPGGIAAFNPTSITAISATVGTTKVEVYKRNATGGVLPDAQLYINGVAQVYDNGQSFHAADGFDVSTSGDTFYVFSITGPGFRATITESSATMNLAMNVDGDVRTDGLLGSSDGNAANDFKVNGSATTHTATEVRQHGAALYEFTDSWRITTLADSAFTVAYSGFNDANPVFTAEGLEPFRQRVADMFASLAGVCTVSAGSESYLLDSLAFELAIGRTLASLANYTCYYQVLGTVTAGDYPVVGAKVEVTAPGLTSCTTVTRVDGSYGCFVHPDLAAAAGGALTFPLPASVTVSVPYVGTVLASGSTELASRAVVGGTPVGAALNLTVDPSLITIAHVSGTMKRDGQPLTAQQAVAYSALDVNGNELLSYSAYPTPDPVTGGYSFTTALPFGTSRLRGSARYGMTWSDRPTFDVSGLMPGDNDVPFSFDIKPTMLRVTGRMVDGSGAPLSSPQYVFLGYTSPVWGIDALNGAVPVDLAADGSFTLEQEIPSDAATVTATSRLGASSEDWVSATTPVTKETTNSITLNVTYNPPVVHLTGTMLATDGSPYTNPVRFHSKPFAGTRQMDYVRFWAEPDASGQYTVAVPMPNAATSVELVAEFGGYAIDWPSRTINLVRGRNDLTFDMRLAVPTLVVSGVLTRNGTPLVDGTNIHMQAYNAAGSEIASLSSAARQDASGNYTVTFDLPAGAVRARLRAATSPYVSDWITKEVTGLAAGANNVTFDADDVPQTLAVSGMLTRNGAPYTWDLSFAVIDSFVGGTQNPVTVYPSVQPDATGAYSFVARVPKGADRSVVNFYLQRTGDPFDERIRTEFIGLTAGRSDRTFDVNVVPRTVTVSGKMLSVNGQAPPGLVSLRLVFSRPGFRFTDFDLQVDPDDQGNYSISTPAPMDATQMDAIAGVSNPAVSARFDLAPGDQSITFDAGATQKMVTVHGRAARDGVAARQVRVIVEYIDARSTSITTTTSDWVEPDANGNYSVSTGPIPIETERVNYRLEYSYGNDDRVSTGTKDVVFGRSLDIAVDLAVRTAVLNGRLVDTTGNPVAKEMISIGGRMLDGSNNVLGEYRKDITIGADGVFSVPTELPASIREFNLQLGHMIVSGMGFDATEFATTWDFGDIVESGPTLRVFSFNANTSSPTVTIRVRPYQWDKSDYAKRPPYTALPFLPDQVVPVTNGELSTTMKFPIEANVAEVEMFVGADQVDRAVFDLDRFGTDLQVGLEPQSMEPRTAVVMVTTRLGGGEFPCGDARSASGYRFNYVISGFRADGQQVGDVGGSAIPDPATGVVYISFVPPADAVSLRIVETLPSYEGIADMQPGNSAAYPFPLPTTPGVPVAVDLRRRC